MGDRCREGASVCVNSSCWFRTGSSDSTAPRPSGAAEDVSAPVRSMASGIPSGPSGTASGTVRRRAPGAPDRPRPARGPGPVGTRRGHPVGPRQARRPRPWRRPAPSGARCRAPPGRARRSGAATGPAKAFSESRRAIDLGYPRGRGARETEEEDGPHACTAMKQVYGQDRPLLYFIFYIAGGLAVFLIKPPTTLWFYRIYGLLRGYIHAP